MNALLPQKRVLKSSGKYKIFLSQMHYALVVLVKRCGLPQTVSTAKTFTPLTRVLTIPKVKNANKKLKSRVRLSQLFTRDLLLLIQFIKNKLCGFIAPDGRKVPRVGSQPITLTAVFTADHQMLHPQLMGIYKH